MQRMASTLLKVLLLVMVATCALTLLLLVPTSEAAGGGSSSFFSSNAGGGGGGLLRSKPRRRMFEANNIVPCDLQSYSYTAVNHDRATGTKCWDRVQLKSCYGHCHTAEIPDYRFPFKKSYHHVCTYHEKVKKPVTLKNCDEGAPSHLKLYETIEAVSCICKLCETTKTNCEVDTAWLLREY